MSIRELFGGGPVLEFPPTSTAQQGEVLTVGPNQALVWAAVTAEGTVTGTTNQIDVQSAGGNVTVSLDPSFVNVPGSLGYNATTGQSMQFPAQRGTADQVLATDGAGTLYWTNQTGGGGSNVVGTPTEIVASTSGGTTTLSFDTTTSIPGTLTINAATTPMVFPSNAGGPGQVLSTDGIGQLQWVSETTSGTIAGTPNEIVASTAGSTTTLAFDTITNIPGKLTVNSAGAQAYSLPIAVGGPGQVLAWPPTGNACVWESVSSAGTINGTPNQIDVSTAGGESSIALNSALIIPGSIKIGDYNMPLTSGTSGQVLTSAGPNATLTWASQSSSGSITGAQNQIDVNTTGGNSVISIDSALELPGTLTIGSGVNSYTFPVVRGTAGQVLETNASGVLSWQNVSGSSGVSSLTTSDANISLSASTGAVAINLANPPTYGPASEKYVMPASMVSPVVGTEYALKVSTVASGTAVLAFEPATVGGITAVNGTQGKVTVSAPVAGAVTCSLPTIISLGDVGSALEINGPNTSSTLNATNLIIKGTQTNLGADISSATGVEIYTSTGGGYTLPTTTPVVNQVLTAGASGVCTWQSPGAATAISGTANCQLVVGSSSLPAVTCEFNVLSTLKHITIDFTGVNLVQYLGGSSAFSFQTNPVPYPAGCAPTLANQNQTLGQVYWYKYTQVPSTFDGAGTAWVILQDQGQASFIIWVTLQQTDLSNMNKIDNTQLFAINGTNAGNVPQLSPKQSFVYI